MRCVAPQALPAQLQTQRSRLRTQQPPAHPAAMQARQIMQQMHNAVAAAEWGGQDGDPELSIGNSVEDPMSSMDEEGEVRRAWGRAAASAEWAMGAAGCLAGTGTPVDRAAP